MSSSNSPVQSATLLTIITETALKDSVVKLLEREGVTGYTLSQAQGDGSHGRRMGDIPGYNTNIEIKTIVSSEISDTILTVLKEHKGTHALIAYRHTVEALLD